MVQLECITLYKCPVPVAVFSVARHRLSLLSEPPWVAVRGLQWWPFLASHRLSPSGKWSSTGAFTERWYFHLTALLFSMCRPQTHHYSMNGSREYSGNVLFHVDWRISRLDTGNASPDSLEYWLKALNFRLVSPFFGGPCHTNLSSLVLFSHHNPPKLLNFPT